MEIIRVTEKNIDEEHICCAISSNKDCQVAAKKGWMKEQFDNGLIFLKGNVRGKCFIEYIPAENAWVPVEADGYMYINCLWIAGQFKGQGYSNMLLEECIKDAKEKGKKGLVILSSKKKRGYMADPKYLQYKGFQTVDLAAPYFELMYLPFEEEAEKPRFKEHVKSGAALSDTKGFVLYYTSQCPFTAKYVPLLKNMAKSRGVELKVNHIGTKEDARKSSCPYTSFSLYYNGEFETHEILSEKKFEKLLESKGL